mmetsp:Transcript_69899/g.138363  ORF Transcript_69899/g.138363 Transcript_69899/m.138363 type:complete len:232 (+) Transcript_69899:88-783(+)
MAKISSCLEACRAAALASHSAAGLLTTVRKVASHAAAEYMEAMRLLRTSEARARCAVARLSGIRAKGPAADASATRDTQAAQPSSTVSRSRQRKQKKNPAAMTTSQGGPAAGDDGGEQPALLAPGLHGSGNDLAIDMDLQDSTAPEPDGSTRKAFAEVLHQYAVAMESGVEIASIFSGLRALISCHHRTMHVSQFGSAARLPDGLKVLNFQQIGLAGLKLLIFPSKLGLLA